LSSLLCFRASPNQQERGEPLPEKNSFSFYFSFLTKVEISELLKRLNHGYEPQSELWGKFPKQAA
jgi:hypothetical protein